MRFIQRLNCVFENCMRRRTEKYSSEILALSGQTAGAMQLTLFVLYTMCGLQTEPES